VSTLCRTTDLSVTVLPIGFEIGRLFGGFFLPPSQLPPYFIWLDAISYVGGGGGNGDGGDHDDDND
jgi:ATP-binding cassette, subfamily G (WHITE), member 2